MSSLADNSTVNDHRCVLVVSHSERTITCFEKNLLQAEFSIIVARDSEQALVLFASKQISHILIDVCLPDMPCNKLVRCLREKAGDLYIPIIVLATNDNEELPLSMSSGCDDILFKPFTLMALKRRIASLDQMCELKYLYKESVNEQFLANQILNNALGERSLQFEEIELLNRAKAVFCGDLFLTARCPDGSLNVLLADFTGHGLSAAIGALPVADVFSTMTKKGFELDYILENIDTKLHTLLPSCMFMACIILNISKDLKSIQLWNGGMPDIYIREYGTGCISKKIKSSHIPLGIDKSIKNNFKIKNIDISQGDQIIIYTDGLTEALNADDKMFGCQEFDQCLNENTDEISAFSFLVNAFNIFCGAVNPADDVTLVCVPCIPGLMRTNDTDISNNI